ncbi:MAG TPA: CpcT/CpeT family chromophore lyase [Phycisphaerales bacterium]|nr:CpcT/CpeT family chromophore lyase [Phycisphaerales bacterium]
MRRTHVLAAAGLLVMAAGAPAALGQGETPEPAQAAQPEAAPAAPAWSEEDFASIAGLLTGSWRTTQAVGQEEPTEIVMSIVPARLSALPDAMYLEIARSDSLDRPYTRSFLQLYRRQGEIRMRTLEVRDPNSDLQNLLIGMWAAPEYIPDIQMKDLLGTLDLALTRSGDGWVGETPYPYPTAVNGAVEMTSRIEIAPGRLQTADRGYDADGNVVWGVSEGEYYVFEPTEPPFEVERNELGLVAITLRDDTTAEPFAEGDTVAFQYTGWLTNGTMFATSRRQGERPLQYQVPGTLVEGWKLGTEGMSKGDWRKFIVPPSLGYGPSGAGAGRIPPDATLVFETELVHVQPAPEQPVEGPTEGGADAAGEE